MNSICIACGQGGAKDFKGQNVCDNCLTLSTLGRDYDRTPPMEEHQVQEGSKGE